MKRLAAPILIGLVGAAILVALGVWQVQRLEWKQGILREIESTIGGDPIALPADPDPEAHLYAPVTLDGSIGPGEVHVLVSQKRQGAGYRVIAPFATEDGRRVLVDRGFVPVTEKDAPRRIGETALRGNLHWPDDRNPSTPENDMGGNTWFARDIAALADTLDTDPVLVVVRSETPATPGIQPLPVSTAGIPNDHLQYAITWFSLAAIWIGMTVIWIRRDTFARQSEEPLR
ncbi:SURF1 family protein [Roseivivax jejudonensis]|uniref:SURF1-like protein n=1 Tax=Roseivivax jejudonensis TaxID=1529041 RepID=A0A1X7A7J6_9RHOB|nr:SURF1 family protein [Roseivivax jejudonensis]SLN72496.1 SURF1 family protein [Roseivivax jejudonensis]